jgi:hypothetical protein
MSLIFEKINIELAQLAGKHLQTAPKRRMQARERIPDAARYYSI